MRVFYKVLYGLFVLTVISCSGSIHRIAITKKELQDEIRYLSSDSLKGRLTGSVGDSLAANFIRQKFEAYGLIPLSGDGFQRFKVTDKVVTGKDNSVMLNGRSFRAGEDFAPASFSENGSLASDVVFTGYGFNINNDSLKWNDYNNLNVKGKWVLLLRGDPEPDNTRSKYATYSNDRDKALLAKDMGAAGVLLVSGSLFDKDDNFEPLAKGEFSVGIPAIRIKRSLADLILSKTGTNIKALESKLNTTAKPSSFSTGMKLNGRTDIIQYKVNTRNVTMLLPGEDARLRNQYIIFGAHFDHLGMGGPGSPSRVPDTIAVHHGADDNASGVTMMTELARRFAGTKGSHKRSLIFVAFTGEEEGLLGSRYFTDNPGIDLSKSDVMFNMDMVGCLNSAKELQVSGVGTAEDLKEKAAALGDTNLLKLTFIEEGSGPSDHSSFYARNIPVLFFTTGADAENYHKPSDTWDKINYNGMIVVSDYIFKLASALACDTAKLHFTESGPKSEVSRAYRRRGVTLGIMPDFAGVVKNGLRADLVNPGQPAAIAGMKKGDVIISIEGKPVNNIQDYMYRMSQVKRGEKISVEVMRNNQKLLLIIQL